MGIMDEINAAVKEQSEKRANFFTDNFIVAPLTYLYRKQNEAYKEKLAKKNKQVQAAPKTPAPKTPAPKPSATPPSGRNDALVRLAQGVSDSYPRGSPFRPKFLSGGKVVAK